MKARLSTLLAALLVTGCAAAGPASFDSPDSAAQALAEAIRTDSTDRLGEIFGADAADLVSSGDDVADRNMRARFLEAYDQGHRLDQDEPGIATIVIGPEDWPFPVPVVQDGEAWFFDAEAGRDEIINRRVGRNELHTIETCRALVDAQLEYAALSFEGKASGEYARRFRSGATAGQRDGLYWPTAEGEPPSPLGPLVAEAMEEGYFTAEGEAGGQPYHGYVYRLLESQGACAPGGAQDYLVDGRLLRGFAVLAFPVEYGNSGVMSFIVGANGIVYQADLGPETGELARAMQSYDPDARWTPCD